MTTTIAQPATGASRFAIRADRWDRTWQEQAVERVERLAEAQADLADVHEAAPDALADLYFILSKATPSPEPDLRHDRAVNRRIADLVAESDGVRDVRRFSVGSQVQSTLGCVTFAPYLRELYEDEAVKEAQEAAEQAQAAQDALDALMGAGDGDEGDGGEEQEGAGAPGGQGGVAPGQAEAEAALAEAMEALSDALDRAEGRIGQICRRGAGEMADESEERGEAMRSWGCEEGQWDRMDPTEFIDLADTLTDDHLRRIAKVLGKMENLRIGAHLEKVDAVPTEIYSIELGNDLTRLLPTERLGLLDEDLHDDWLRRYAGRQLLQYRLKSLENRAAGSIILIEDSSGSMHGEKHAWAKAFGLGLGNIARDEDRGFHAIEFGSRNEHKHHPFPDRAAWTVPARIAYASSFLYGAGTDFETPLDSALALLADEYEATGRVSGDVVMLTDGISRVSDAWLERFLAEKERLQFKVYSLLIGDDATDEVLRKFSDFTAQVTNFLDGTDVRDVFKAVA